MHPLVPQKFRCVDLPLRIAASPREFSRRIVDRDTATLFMIDIRSRRGRSRRQEYFLLYCGEKARAAVIDVDRRHQQVILDVAEPSSRVKTRRFDRARRVVVEEEIRISAARRRILAGMDESHLFICPLAERASSVEEAHRKLAPSAVRRAHRSLKVRRQGEWFFLPVTDPQERARVEEAIRSGRVVGDEGITAAGRPHRVEQFLRVGEESYALGRVKHPDHRVLRLKTWHRVFRNTEEINVRPTGMTWVD